MTASCCFQDGNPRDGRGWVTRFAPSPTGFLHLGHAAAALVAWHAACDSGGRFLLRIEDIDPGRCREAFEAAIVEDLAWLGIVPDGAVRRQSDHMADYRGVLDELAGRGLLYPCFCTRADIRREAAEAAHAPHHAPDGTLAYGGTCRGLSAAAPGGPGAAGRAPGARDALAAGPGGGGGSCRARATTGSPSCGWPARSWTATAWWSTWMRLGRACRCVRSVRRPRSAELERRLRGWLSIPPSR
ncbi:MAG: glutamate--tRNA ligase family protein [Gluconacetobacter sp.]